VNTPLFLTAVCSGVVFAAEIAVPKFSDWKLDGNGKLVDGVLQLTGNGSHHKYRAEFSPKNLIDGNKSPDTPFWKPDPRTDLWVKIDFGRECSVEKTLIYLKKLPGQEKTWTSAALVFSDGSKLPIELKFTGEPQEFIFPAKKTSFVQLTDLKETFPLTSNGIAEWEVWGHD
jgi:hypothetical protein